jgi:hypothetical protein
MAGLSPSQEVLSLQTAVYQQADPTADDALHQKLVEAVRRQQQAAPAPRPAARKKGSDWLGPDTTGLSVEHELKFTELPTALYPLLNPSTDPLFVVRVKNTTGKKRRVRVMAYLEGLSAQAVKTVELDPHSEEALKLSPTLLPDKARELTTVQWATLHVVAHDLDGKEERHDTVPLLCLARDSGFNASVIDSATGAVMQDLTHYYGAWVTPYVEPVQQLIREAAALVPNGRMLGYQRAADGTADLAATDAQVEALYNALKQRDIAYVHSVISYGTPKSTFTQRTRLPRETLALKSANCLDAAVLMASLIEGVSLNPALVLVPGHAFVGWQGTPGEDNWRYLEVSMTRSSSFAAARASGEKQYVDWKDVQLKRHELAQLRAQRIWPME